MGKGDLRSRRGKIYNGSYGKKRPGKGKPAPANDPAKTAQPQRGGARRP